MKTNRFSKRVKQRSEKKSSDLNSVIVRYSGDLMRNIGGEPPEIPEYLETVMDSIGHQRAQLNGSEHTGMGTIPFDGSGTALAANGAAIAPDFPVMV
ncbi:hypothetical protein RRG08_001280 [Elysia crispata]|uniref:Uncharacterized protein n=1 Tax=Elysia crispata TaxID=231223 RepID=A0AAE0XE85_9GAST|nr:hypothetical protein RRG08_001280 [Elysia crispata]